MDLSTKDMPCMVDKHKNQGSLKKRAKLSGHDSVFKDLPLQTRLSYQV